jgi:hypothetical protein
VETFLPVRCTRTLHGVSHREGANSGGRGRSFCLLPALSVDSLASPLEAVAAVATVSAERRYILGVYRGAR